MKPRVVYWNNIASPYMVDRFEAVAQRGNLDFEAWFSRRTDPDRSWAVREREWKFRYRLLPQVGIGRLRQAVPTGLFWGPTPDLIVSLYAEFPFVVGWEVAHRRGARTAFWCEATSDSVVKRRKWKDVMKRRMFRLADGIITVGRDGRDFALRYGADPGRVFLAPHAIRAQEFSAGAARARSMRQQLRRELGLRGTAFIYVGRLLQEKGLRHLVGAFLQLQRSSRAEISLLLVGDGPEETRLRRLCKQGGARNVVFAGFRPSTELPALYASSDVFVFPTLADTYGLVLDEAMACALPIISSSEVGEITGRVEHGVNGFLVPPASTSLLAEPMETLANDAELRKTMGTLSAERIQSSSPARWAEDFENAVEAIMSRPGARLEGS